MGIVNLTPDSFSDGGALTTTPAVLAHARTLVDAGALILDLGAESTRPGAHEVSYETERARLMPVLQALVEAALPVAISIDTRRPEIAEEALALGAAMINDVGGAPSAAMVAAVKEADASYVLMHNRGDFAHMHAAHSYEDVVQDVQKELRTKHRSLLDEGLHRDQVWLDVGLGFAKRGEQNWQLCRAMSSFAEMGAPILLGASRKRFLSDALPANQESLLARDCATAAICAVGVARGVQLVRVHNVAACREAVNVGALMRHAHT